MGFWDFLKPKPKKEALRYVPTMSGTSPRLSDFGEDIYSSDLIVQAIRCKATEFKKLQPRHIRRTAGGMEAVSNSSVARILRRPNEHMTQSDFLEKIAILLELNKNVFIYPAYYVSNAGERIYTGLYPLKPQTAEYMQDGRGRVFVRLQFATGYRVDIPEGEIIHWRKDYGLGDFFGGPLSERADAGLLRALDRYERLAENIAKALDVSTKVNGIIKTQTYLNDESQAAALADFNRRLEESESGLMVTDLKSEFQPIARDIKLVDKDTIEFFYLTILRKTGVSLPILNGDYTKAQKEAFYEHALEGDIKSLGEAMTKVLFTEREEAGYGNSVQLYPNSIVFMSMENKLSALQIGLPAGIFSKDEARELLGYPPMPNGQGKVVAQGYNALLDANNDNKLGADQTGTQQQEGGAADGGQEG